MPAFARYSLDALRKTTADRVVADLVTASASAGFAPAEPAQRSAWQVEADVLRACAERWRARPGSRTWRVLLEYPIPRRGRRIDAVLLAGPAVVVLEFKCGAKAYEAAAVRQVEDYALDLADFHRESAGRPIIPFVVATEAPDRDPPAPGPSGMLAPTWLANAANLAELVEQALDRFADTPTPAIDPDRWDRSEYAPTPSIIDAARWLYAGHNVREIAHSGAGAENLTRTLDAILRAIKRAKAARRKRICFVTGVPGAGKTLAGLNVVHNHDAGGNPLGVFLSGNAPLVRVLTEALAQDAARRSDQTRDEARRRVRTFVQNVHRFIEVYDAEPDHIPPDRIVVFDEAQRAWDAAQSRRKFQRDASEPETLLAIMDRHPDWAVVVALIGNGQEINQGEAGLAEWGRALAGRFRHWDVVISPELKQGPTRWGPGLFDGPTPGVRIKAEPALHLATGLRSYRAGVLPRFVDAVLDLDPDAARALASQLGRYPLALTRSLAAAKAWLRRQRRGLRRIGLVATSGARRLRPDGLDVATELDVETWFLNGPDDVRSSHYLEAPATEFAIQGLELDWVGLCWDGDFVPGESGWTCRRFQGTAWQTVRDATKRQFILNKYRVLLTRAREGLVIWVPPGDPDDPTRPPAVYNRVADYLARCGIRPIEEDASNIKALPGQDSNLEKQDQNLL